jgi:hypothetical protein
MTGSDPKLVAWMAGATGTEWARSVVIVAPDEETANRIICGEDGEHEDTRVHRDERLDPVIQLWRCAGPGCWSPGRGLEESRLFRSVGWVDDYEHTCSSCYLYQYEVLPESTICCDEDGVCIECNPQGCGEPECEMRGREPRSTGG